MSELGVSPKNTRALTTYELASKSWALVFKNYVGHGLLGCVSERECDIFRPKFGGDGCGLAMELQCGALALRPHNLNIAPADAMTPARAQCLHPRFFSGKAGGIAFKAGDFFFAVTDLAFSENAAKKAIAKTLDAFANTVDLGDIDPGSENHKSIVNR